MKFFIIGNAEESEFGICLEQDRNKPFNQHDVSGEPFRVLHAFEAKDWDEAKIEFDKYFKTYVEFVSKC